MDTFEAFCNFVGSLVGATKEGLPTHRVAHRFREIFDSDIAFTKMGYPSLEALLVACEKEGQIKKMGDNWMIVSSQANDHMVNLVKNTKTKKSQSKRGRSVPSHMNRAGTSGLASRSRGIPSAFRGRGCGRGRSAVPLMARANPIPTSRGAPFDPALQQPRLPTFGRVRSTTNLATSFQQSKSCASGLDQQEVRFFGSSTNNSVGYAHRPSGSGVPGGFGQERHTQGGFGQERNTASGFANTKPSVQNPVGFEETDFWNSAVTSFEKTVVPTFAQSQGSGFRQNLATGFGQTMGPYTGLRQPSNSSDGTVPIFARSLAPQPIRTTYGTSFDSRSGSGYGAVLPPPPGFDLPNEQQQEQTVNGLHSRSGSSTNLRVPLRSSRLYDNRNTAHEICERHTKYHNRFVAAVGACGGEATFDQMLEAVGRRSQTHVGENEFFKMFGVHSRDVNAVKACFDGYLDVQVIGGELAFSTPSDDDGDIDTEELGLPVSKGSVFKSEQEQRLDSHRSNNGTSSGGCYGPSSLPSMKKKKVQPGVLRHQPKWNEENIAAHLLYRWLRMANGAMKLDAVSAELAKWKVHTRGRLLDTLLTIHSDMFHIHWDMQGHWIYLSEAALPPVGKCSLGTSPRLGPMVMADAIGLYSPGSQWQMVCPASLTFESYRWSDCHRFKVEFLPTDEAALDKLDCFHDDMYDFYKLHWADADYEVVDLVKGGHYVIHDENRNCVRRVRLDREATDGMADVFLMDDLRFDVTQRSKLRRLSDDFAKVPSFGVVLYSPPFRVLDGAEQELPVAFNRLKRSFIAQNCELQINVNHDEGVCRLMQLRSTVNPNVCLPDCLEDDHFIMVESKLDDPPFSASDDEDMWGEE